MKHKMYMIIKFQDQFDNAVLADQIEQNDLPFELGKDAISEFVYNVAFTDIKQSA